MPLFHRRSGQRAALFAGCLLFYTAVCVDVYAEVFPAEPVSSPEEKTVESNRPLRWIYAALPPRLAASARNTTALHLPSIPGIDEALTQRYIRQYASSGGLAWLTAVMQRGAPYLPFIRQEIEERNLPPELIYLPVIESGFQPAARSPSGAVGLWQFMRNSISPFDMKVTEWMDERMDFWKSTQGALRKLEENYRALGDWPLALAAYNAGMGAINRIVSGTGTMDYWQLAERKILKTESIHYVPKLLAVAYILNNPRYFGLDLNWPEAPQWARIAVDRQVDLDILAAEAGVDAAELKTMNRELSFNVTPPSEYYLKVRVDDVENIRQVLNRPDVLLIRYYYHTIQYGDTLSALALRYGTSVAQITNANPGVEPRALKLGVRLKIPALTGVNPAKQQAVVQVPVFEGNHIVRQGETLWSIALAYDIDPLALASANGMQMNETLRIGRNLKTPILKRQGGSSSESGDSAGGR
ncbi:MAG: LysM peptidoglycan-binding domain-containing protein [Treponema sp.]|jgi:membrane-bound lytic murein transglycosylase D|nr:LysM peptidoglycan-binding domain-containing protein [Treponema sp.]